MEDLAPPKPTLLETIPVLLESEIRPKRSPNYFALHSLVWRVYLAPAFGNRDTQSISEIELRDWRDGLQVSNATKNRYCRAAEVLLRLAGNRLHVSTLPETPHVPWCLSPGEEDRLFKLPMGPRSRVMLLLALRAGLGRSEMAGLRHEDRDDDGITVKRQTLEVEGRLIEDAPLKTRNRRAWVPLPPELLSIIGPPKAGYVLATDTGAPLRPPNMRQELARITRGTEFACLTLHDLRHTYGMRLLEMGVDLRTAAEMMRHDPAMLARVYARSRRDLKREAVRKAFGNLEATAERPVEVSD